MNLGGAFPPPPKTPTNFGGLVSVPKNHTRRFGSRGEGGHEVRVNLVHQHDFLRKVVIARNPYSR